jgi:hypothetical protein
MGKYVKKQPVDRSQVITDPKLIGILHKAAGHFGYPVDLVANAFATYYAAVKSAMERPEMPSIRMLNMGQFRVSTGNMQKHIKKLRSNLVFDKNPEALRQQIETLEDILQREYMRKCKTPENE